MRPFVLAAAVGGVEFNVGLDVGEEFQPVRVRPPVPRLVVVLDAVIVDEAQDFGENWWAATPSSSKPTVLRP